MRSTMVGVRGVRSLVALVGMGVALAACGNDGAGDTGANANAGAGGQGGATQTLDVAAAADAAAHDGGQAAQDVQAGTAEPDASTGVAEDTGKVEDTAAAAVGDSAEAQDGAALVGDDAADSGSAPDTGSADTGSADTGSADTGSADTGSADSVGADSTVADSASADTAAAGDTAAVDAAPAPKVVRFAALGDAGTGSAEQYAVGKALGEKCKQDGCDFVLYLGDNFYDTGVKDENDKQFAEKFEKPYETVDAPFYVVLGNHDYGAGGAGAEFLKKDFYVKYSKKNPKFHLPDAWWNVQVEHVHLFALDSNALLYGDVLPFIIQKQLAEVDAAIKASTAPWKISFAHHPMRSNGPHGNAGCYEGAKAAPIPQLCGLIPVASGKGVKEAYDKLLCGRVDVHLSGHDHGRQWLDKAASTKFCKDVELLVSGGGAKTTNVETKSKGGFEFNPFHFQDADKSGFLYVEITGDTFKGQFIDSAGKVEFERSFQRTPK